MTFFVFRRASRVNPIRSWHVVLLLSFSSLVTFASAATPKEIQQAVDQAKAYLCDRQLKNHTWEYEFDGHGNQKTGQTALAVYALLCAGESPQDERIAPAIEYLRKTPTTGVYALGLRCQIWLMLPPTQEVKQAMNRDANILVRALKRGAGPASGFYDYNGGGTGGNYSHSRSQYGVLGVWAAEQMGLNVPREYWFVVEKAWLEHQDASGGWSYRVNDGSPLTAGMTAVGVATLFITQDYLRAADAVNCGGNMRNEGIERGMRWLSDHFEQVAPDEKTEELPRMLPYSTLYAIERVGVASGYKYFNGIDWYAKGADWLVNKQKSNGSFPEEFTGIPNYTTGLAVLFLIRGSSPLMMNKLDYSAARTGPPSAEGAERPRQASSDNSEPHWNQRPRDVANLARWTGRQVERELNWQIVNLDGPVDDFHDAPILYIAGNQKLELGDEQMTKIKLFVEQGGLVLGHADCSSENFVNGFKEMAGKMFPSYEFAPLPDNHVIYTNQQFPRSKWKGRPNVLSMSNGARELMLLLPDADMARGWQMQQWSGPREEHFQLAANIYLYAVDKKNARRRGESYLVKRDDTITPTRALKLARIGYIGNWDPEPGGWRRLASVMHNENDVELIVEPARLGTEKLGEYKIAHWTGTAAFKLDDAARAEIKNFVKGGGLLIIDAAGGSTAFAAAAETELAAMFPESSQQLTQVLPPDHVIYAKDGKSIEIEYRPYARSKIGNLRGPQLRGVTIDGRLAIIFSREDLSVGLVGQAVDGIVGYTPAAATRVMANILTSTLPPSAKGTTNGATTKSTTTRKK
jgi:hypothetical protein